MLKTIAHALIPGEDAISLLKDDHRKVESLFKQFESSDDKREKVKIAREICMELSVHDKLESKILYPASAKSAKEKINEGIVEHESIRRLIREIPLLKGSDEFFETRVNVLIEYVKHHVKEEENSMFPLIVESKTDLKALGEQMSKAKKRYQSEYEATSAETARPTRTKSVGTRAAGPNSANSKHESSKSAPRASAA